MKIGLILSAVICASLAGCTDSTGNQTGGEFAKTSSVSYVCVGMENSKRFGSCPGCKLDSDRMHQLLGKTFGYSGVLLQSAQATREAVSAALRDAIAKTAEDGLFIFYYSGHGGREFLNSAATSEPVGADEADEYLCLYDKPLIDDEVWGLITACRGRVFLVFDCCHSQTMFRSVESDIMLAKGLAIPLEQHIVTSTGFRLKPRAVALGTDEELKMLCWSGCLEAEYSYGSSRGGVMTNSIMSRWRKGMTYASLWTLVAKDVSKSYNTQHPVATQYGGVFTEAFR